MTDNEIIKALECCLNADSQFDCYECCYHGKEHCLNSMIIDVLNLINRQKAEIERLAKLTELDDEYIKNLEKAFNDRTAELQDAKFDNQQLRRDVERLDKRRINDCRHWQEKYNSLKAEAVKEFLRKQEIELANNTDISAVGYQSVIELNIKILKEMGIE